MHINVIQAILIGFLCFLCQSGTPWLTAFMGNYVRQPLVNGAIVGLIMGDPVQGLIIGSAINLPFIGVIMVGSTMPTDSALAGIVGTALALASGASPEVAVSMAVPIGLLGNLLWTVHMTKNCIFVHMMDKAAETGDVKRMNFLHVWPPQITTAFLMTIPVALVVYFGADVAKTAIDSLSGMPLHMLEVIGGTLRLLMSKKSVILFFLLGFLMVTYQGFSMIVVALFAIIIAYFYTDLSSKRTGE